MSSLLNLLTKYCATAMLLALVSMGCAQKTPEEQIASARQHQAKNDHRAAVLELKTALQTMPDHAEARMLLGKSLLMLKDYPSAEKELQKARELAAPADELFPLLGQVLLRLGQHERLLKEINPVPTLGKDSLAAIHAYRSKAYLALRQPESAIQELTAGEIANPQHHEILLLKAKLAYSNRQPAVARQLAEQALNSNNRFIDALYFQAQLAAADGLKKEVIRYYQQITSLDPTEYLAHLGIAELQLSMRETGQAEQAIKAAEQALQAAEKAAPQSPLVKQARAVLELQRGDMNAANQAVLQVLKIAPDYAPALHLHALVNFALGNFEQSRRSAEKLYRQHPDSENAARLLISNLLRAGDIKTSREILNRILTKDTKDPALLTLAAEAHLRLGEHKEGVALLQRAAQLAPTQEALKIRLATSAMSTGDTEQAMDILQQAVQVNAEVSAADLALVGLYLRERRFEEALKVIADIEQKGQRSPMSLTLRASALLGKGDRAGARQAMEQAVSLQPTYLPAILNLARLDLEDRRPEQARKRFEAVLKQDKDNLQALLSLAELAMLGNRPDQAVIWLERAASAHPKSVQTRVALVRQYLSAARDHKKALEHAKAAAEHNPNDLESLALLGSTQLAIGQKEAALGTYQRITQQWPKVPDVWVGLAHVYLSSGQAQSGRDALRRALQLQPDHLPAQRTLIQLELAEKKPKSALDVARQIQAQRPKSSDGYSLEGDIHMIARDPSRAVTAYEQAVKYDTGNSTLIKLHRALLEAGNVKQAEQRLAAWLKTHPRDLQARAQAAESYIVTGHNQLAISHYEELLRMAPNDARAANNLAYLYYLVKDPRASPQAETALRLAPNNPVSLDTLGWILVETGNVERGLYYLQQAAASAPNSELIRYHYGVALARSGRKAEARREIEAALRSGMPFAGRAEAMALLRQL